MLLSVSLRPWSDLRWHQSEDSWDGVKYSYYDWRLGSGIYNRTCGGSVSDAVIFASVNLVETVPGFISNTILKLFRSENSNLVSADGSGSRSFFQKRIRFALGQVYFSLASVPYALAPATVSPSKSQTRACHSKVRFFGRNRTRGLQIPISLLRPAVCWVYPASSSFPVRAGCPVGLVARVV